MEENLEKYTGDITLNTEKLKALPKDEEQRRDA
jgi:hypothetical protein